MLLSDGKAILFLVLRAAAKLLGSGAGVLFLAFVLPVEEYALGALGSMLFLISKPLVSRGGRDYLIAISGKKNYCASAVKTVLVSSLISGAFVSIAIIMFSVIYLIFIDAEKIFLPLFFAATYPVVTSLSVALEAHFEINSKHSKVFKVQVISSLSALTIATTIALIYETYLSVILLYSIEAFIGLLLLYKISVRPVGGHLKKALLRLLVARNLQLGASSFVPSNFPRFFILLLGLTTSLETVSTFRISLQILASAQQFISFPMGRLIQTKYSSLGEGQKVDLVLRYFIAGLCLCGLFFVILGSELIPYISNEFLPEYLGLSDIVFVISFAVFIYSLQPIVESHMFLMGDTKGFVILSAGASLFAIAMILLYSELGATYFAIIYVLREFIMMVFFIYYCRNRMSVRLLDFSKLVTLSLIVGLGYCYILRYIGSDNIYIYILVATILLVLYIYAHWFLHRIYVSSRKLS